MINPYMAYSIVYSYKAHNFADIASHLMKFSLWYKMQLIDVVGLAQSADPGLASLKFITQPQQISFRTLACCLWLRSKVASLCHWDV